MKNPSESKTGSGGQINLIHKPGDEGGAGFWLCASLLAVMLSFVMSQDISRPFIGLHSWGQAHDAWVARSHVRYGLGYTKGFDTFAIGNPPAAKPTRYLDHPVLFALVNAAAMSVLGINEWALRVTNIAATAIALLLFLRILKQLTDEATALLAGLFFCLFPITAYFGVNQWLYPLALLAIWNYLVLIGAFKESPQPKPYHKIILAASLFLALQMTWEGFFFALAIGIHYLAHCIKKKSWPQPGLLAILIAAPLLSLALDFVILAAGQGWDFNRLFQLAKIRSSEGEVKGLTWPLWFGRFWDHAITNFTLPVLFVVIITITLGQLYAFTAGKEARARRFPQFWLFAMPAIFQLVIMRGTLWPHQYWERPMALPLAIAAALAVMMVYDIAGKIKRYIGLAAAGGLVIFLLICCVIGTNYYYGLRWQVPERIDLFKFINAKTPPDKAMLCYDVNEYIINQFPGVKAASYRPEFAWYIDREIEQASTIGEIEAKAKTGRFVCYVISPYVNDPRAGELIKQLRARYKLIASYPFIPWEYKFPPWIKKEVLDNPSYIYIRGMMPELVFDLTSKPAS